MTLVREIHNPPHLISHQLATGGTLRIPKDLNNPTNQRLRNRDGFSEGVADMASSRCVYNMWEMIWEEGSKVFTFLWGKVWLYESIIRETQLSYISRLFYIVFGFGLLWIRSCGLELMVGIFGDWFLEFLWNIHSRNSAKEFRNPCGMWEAYGNQRLCKQCPLSVATRCCANEKRLR